MSALRSILEGKREQAVHYVGPDATVREAVAKMCQLHIGALLVEVQEQPIGIVSERDILMRLLLRDRDPATTLVSEIMTTDVLCISPEVEPEEVMALMTERRVRHIPVVEDNVVVGLVSIGDLVRWLTLNQEFEIRVLRDYVSGVYPG